MTSRSSTGTPTQSLVWDAEGRLGSVTTASPAATVASYLYDASGERLLRREAGKATLYLGSTEISASVSDASAPATGVRYYSHGDRVIATRTGPAKSHVTTLFADPQGTATHSATNTTSVLTTRRSTPYGAPRQWPVWPSDRGFLHGPVDAGTGLTHLGAREYDPSLARFISVDPLLDTSVPLHLNGYGYALNNPTTFSDPDGRFFRGMMLSEGFLPVSKPARKPIVPGQVKLGKGTARSSYGDDRRTPTQAPPKPRPPVVAPKKTPTRSASKVPQVAPARTQSSSLSEIGTVLWNGVKEISGYNDGKACLTQGDWEACTWFAVGFVPGGKFAKGAKLALDASTTALRTTKTTARATNGGAASVRLGQAGETAVRSAFDIGPKSTRVVNGRTRIFDGLNSSAVSEVKNVQRLSYTGQLRDYADYASQNGLRFDIYVRGGTNISGPLARADLDPVSPVNIIRYLE